MSEFAVRRYRSITLLVLAVIAAVAIYAVLTVAIYPTPFVSGWTLFGLVFFLAAYNVRKRLSMIPLGSSATWLQCHIYAGLFSGALFLLHLEFRLPTGWFDGLLAGSFLATFISGVLGLLLTRTLPDRLTSRGPEVIFEQIPILIRQVREEIEDSILGSISDSGLAALPELYVSRLKPFFAGPRNMLWHLAHSRRPLHRLLLEVRAYEPFLSETERQMVNEVARRIQEKDDLDYQFALQSALKYWLFIHVPLTYALLVFAVFHLLTVYAFAGGYR